MTRPRQEWAVSQQVPVSNSKHESAPATLQLLEAAPLHQWPHLTGAAGCIQHCWPSKNRTEEVGCKFRGKNVFLVMEV